MFDFAHLTHERVFTVQAFKLCFLGISVGAHHAILSCSFLPYLNLIPLDIIVFKYLVQVQNLLTWKDNDLLTFRTFDNSHSWLDKR